MRPVSLGSRAVAVLTTLVERTDEYVQKGAIIDAAWPGVVVEEGNLAVQISSIRRVLAHAPGGEHWIETLARRGYRFVGPVIEVHDNVAQSSADSGERSNLPTPLTSFTGTCARWTLPCCPSADSPIQAPRPSNGPGASAWLTDFSRTLCRVGGWNPPHPGTFE